MEKPLKTFAIATSLVKREYPLKISIVTSVEIVEATDHKKAIKIAQKRALLLEPKHTVHDSAWLEIIFNGRR